jgi:hypothetical protein
MMRLSCSFERDVHSNRPSEILSDGAFKENASALGVRVRQTHDGWGATTTSLGPLCSMLAGQSAPKVMICEEIADTFG